MSPFRAWSDAPAFVLSCQGPLRRHSAALSPIAQLVLPQCLLGGEAQLAAFAAATPDIAEKTFFAPLPEMFGSAGSLQAGWASCGQPHHSARSVVHLRFGSTRTARVLKGARNGAVIAEAHGEGPLTASQHPFASGLVLPAAMRRVFVYGSENTRPMAAGGGVLAATRLAPAFVTADIDRAMAAPGWDQWEVTDGAAPGVDLVPFSEFRAGVWASGQSATRAGNALRRTLRMAKADGIPFVLVPWNMDHPGSIVPELLVRLSRLQGPAAPRMRLLVMAFNYLGQTGIIRRLIAAVREAAGGYDQILADIFLIRVTNLAALPALWRLTRVAWVDGNDPEWQWTLRRLEAAGITPILLGTADGNGVVARVEADDIIWMEADTRYGLLNFKSGMVSQRALPGLLAFTASQLGAPGPAPARRPRRQAEDA